MNRICDEKFNLERFKKIKSCCNVFDLVKMETTCIQNRKPTLLDKNNLAIVLIYLLNAFFGVYIFIFN